MIEYYASPYRIFEMIRDKEIIAIKQPDGSVIPLEDIKEVILPDGTVKLV